MDRVYISYTILRNQQQLIYRVDYGQSYLARGQAINTRMEDVKKSMENIYS